MVIRKRYIRLLSIILTGFLIIVIILIYNARKSSISTIGSTVNDNDFVGSWLYLHNGVHEVGGEEMDFSIDSKAHHFNSYLNSRPEYVDCGWNRNDNLVSITCLNNPELNIDLHIISISAGTLIIESDLYSGTFQKKSGM